MIRAFSECPSVDLCAPEGAFYAFPRINNITSSEPLVREILESKKVGLAPGSAFGPLSDAYFRICFARSPENLQIALDRIVSYFKETGN